MSKPARYIQQLTDKLRQRDVDAAAAAARIADLERECDFLRDVATDAKAERDAVLAERNQVAAKLHDAQVAASQRSTQDAVFYQAMVRVLGQYGADAMRSDRVGYMTKLVADHAAEVAALINDHAGERAELEKRDRLLVQKESEITALVAKVEGRMRERERQQAAAVLNRKAVAQVVPGRNRG